MIATIEGSVAETFPAGSVVDVAGVGYLVQMPVSTMARLPARGSRVRLHTHLIVRDDGMSLYGFLAAEERDLFQVLLGVSGVGPKAALAVLSAYTPDALRRAIVTEDVSALTVIPGIGKKTAGRMVIDLRERLALPDALGVGGATPERRAALGEVGGALAALGYTPPEVQAALGALEDGDGTVEELLRRALRQLARA